VYAAAIVIAAALASCKSGDKLSNLGTAPSRSTTTTTSTTIANGGTAADGSPLTSSAGGTTTIPKTATTLTPANLVKETGTTAVTTKPNTDHLALPKAGDYTFRDTKTDSNGTDAEDAQYAITVEGQTVRTERSGLSAAGRSYFEETHRADGLFLTRSVLSGGSCAWSPAAASLPQSVIDGGNASTDSTCSTKIGTASYTFKLSVDLSFKRLRTVVIGGTEYRCIDITRHRVLTNDDGTETVDAVDTYAFKLGLRIEVSEQVVAKSGDKTSTHTHKAILTALPS
jgi:hypothetical protein